MDGLKQLREKLGAVGQPGQTMPMGDSDPAWDRKKMQAGDFDGILGQVVATVTELFEGSQDAHVQAWAAEGATDRDHWFATLAEGAARMFCYHEQRGRRAAAAAEVLLAQQSVALGLPYVLVDTVAASEKSGALEALWEQEKNKVAVWLSMEFGAGPSVPQGGGQTAAVYRFKAGLHEGKSVHPVEYSTELSSEAAGGNGLCPSGSPSYKCNLKEKSDQLWELEWVSGKVKVNGRSLKKRAVILLDGDVISFGSGADGKERLRTFRHPISCGWETPVLRFESERRRLVDYFTHCVVKVAEPIWDSAGHDLRVEMRDLDHPDLLQPVAGGDGRDPTALGKVALHVFTLYAAGKQNDGGTLRMALEGGERFRSLADGAARLLEGADLAGALRDWNSGKWLTGADTGFVLGALMRAARNFNAHEHTAHAHARVNPGANVTSWWTMALLRGLNFMTVGILLAPMIREEFEGRK